MSDFLDRQLKKLSAKRRAEVYDMASQIILCNRLWLGGLRKKLKLTQVEVAKRMGVKQSMISQIENNDDIMVSTLIRYVKALGCDISINAVVNKEKFLLY